MRAKATFKEIKSKTSYIPVGWFKLKRQQIPSIDNNLEQVAFSFTAGGSVN